MNPQTSNGDPKPQHVDSQDSRISVPYSSLAKNKSTSNLLPQAARSRPSVKSRYSLDIDTAILEDSDQLLSPIISEHSSEHGLGLSGLRRIRHQPPSRDSATPTLSRSGSLSLSPSLSRSSSATFLGAPSPNLNAIEDLHRFPSESLHSFSFTHQSEESIHNRQNVLKRSIDFMRDKLGWAASNPGLIAAQAKLSGDHEVQSMVELLARANLIGDDANHTYGLGVQAPLTGPADVTGNVFDESFASPRSEEPESARKNKPAEPETAMSNSDNNNHNKEVGIESSLKPALISPSKASFDNTLARDTLPQRPRSLLKRTLTNTDELQLQKKLTDTLAQPYNITDDKFSPSPTFKKYPSLPPLNVSGPLGQPINHPQSAAPHGHGTRWAPVPQAIFTTEVNSPWTITAANDLACLVFGVTNAEVRKLGILEVVKEERRKWLEEKLKDPDTGSIKAKPQFHSTRSSPNPTSTNMNVGSGITARLLSKPPSRYSNAHKKRSQSDDGAGSTYASRNKPKSNFNHSHHKSRGVILCGDVVPIRKRNGDIGSATLWVKEKKGGLIWVLEEINEDVAHVDLDEVGCVNSATGAVEEIWAVERIRRGMDIKKLIPAIPRMAGTNTGALDLDSIFNTRNYTARATNDINIPIAIETGANHTFRISSFPHIAGIMVLQSESLKITSSNTVVTSALFGQPAPDGLHINEILPGFDKLLKFMTNEDKIELKDGIVIPEHNFRRARSLLSMREGKADAASIFLRPSGLIATHRDGSEIMVDVQMRVVKNVTAIEDDVITEKDEDDLDDNLSPVAEVAYALWITYSRHLHTSHLRDNISLDQNSQISTLHKESSSDQIKGQAVQPIDEQLSPQQSTTTKTITTTSSLSSSSSSSSSSNQLTKTNSNPAPISKSPIISGRNNKLINDFIVLEDMGQGAYGQVKLCRYKKAPSNKSVIKYVTKSRILVDTWTRDRRLGTVPLEIHVLDFLRKQDLKHPNIVEMADFFEDDINYYIEMVPHGLPGMDLFDYIELRSNMEESEARRIFVQVAEAVYHLHLRAKVVHRDIKDENVILDGDQNIKLIDFGSAAYIKNGPFDVFVGTIDYAAPEVLAGQPYRGKEQDVWALGILLYTIIYKENPFYSIDEILDHDLRVPYVISETSIDLIRRMLNRDVDERVSISEVLDHPWCKGIGSDSDE